MKNMFRIVWAILLIFAWGYLHYIKSTGDYRYVTPPTPRTIDYKTPTTPLQYHPSPTPTIGPVLASQ